MGTHCKIIIGYADKDGLWIENEKMYYRHYDGYPEAVLPLLKEYGTDIDAMNEVAEYEGHKFELIEPKDWYRNKGQDFLYYININLKETTCTVLGLDFDFWHKYQIDNYKVVEELVL